MNERPTYPLKISWEPITLTQLYRQNAEVLARPRNRHVFEERFIRAVKNGIFKATAKTNQNIRRFWRREPTN